MKLRHASAEDVTDLARIYVASRAEAMPWLPVLHTAAEDLEFFMGLVHSTKRMWVAESPEGIAGFCTVDENFLDQLYVHPSFQQQGIGSLLMEKARADLDYLSLWVFQKNTGAQIFYQKRGFHCVLETDGENSEEREPDCIYSWHRALASHSIHLRAENTTDQTAIRGIHTAAFGQEAEGKLVEKLRAGGHFAPEMSLLAVHPKEGALGHVLFSDLSLESDAGNIRAASLAPVAVRPQHQRKGIGKALIRQGLTNLRLFGYEAVLVLGDPTYYTKLGFARSLAEKLECEYQCEALMALELAPGSLSDREGITVSYPPPFQDLE